MKDQVISTQIEVETNWERSSQHGVGQQMMMMMMTTIPVVGCSSATLGS